MEIEYFMSSLASDVMGILTENFLWMRTLGSTPILESEVLFPKLVFISVLHSARAGVNTEHGSVVLVYSSPSKVLEA